MLVTAPRQAFSLRSGSGPRSWHVKVQTCWIWRMWYRSSPQPRVGQAQNAAQGSTTVARWNVVITALGLELNKRSSAGAAFAPDLLLVYQLALPATHHVQCAAVPLTAPSPAGSSGSPGWQPSRHAGLAAALAELPRPCSLSPRHHLRPNQHAMRHRTCCKHAIII